MEQGIKEVDIKAFKKACENLNNVINRIVEYQPNARLFMAEYDMCLMSEDDSEKSSRERQESVIAQVTIKHSDCGGW